ncbi:alpha/beta hydrolase [Streptomyces sp. NBC_00378]|uniref:alpha/beta hydrolase n=1 Tax=unclassified Streptomyces TaxID=2593676 RepID=UPI0022531BF2|nr:MULTISPECIES: alpha/beta hydrolase [unclassified Streptomyces]MCX5112693.1 alpha/beta hydrolase [Streptomyces sp. NBC_00378]
MPLPLPVDPELAPWLALLPALDVGDAAAARATVEAMGAAAPPFVLPEGVESSEHRVVGAPGAPEVPMSVFRPAGSGTGLPAVLYVHGGGFILEEGDGDRALAARWAAELGAVVVSVRYRLAPEHPYPAATEDCYAALDWLAANADGLGVDPARIAVAGMSAGGGLAAALALLARDRGGPALCFQLLDIPELDDRLDTPSMREFTDTPVWNRTNAVHSWRAYLGADRDPAAPVPAYAAPARAEDLSGLPPAYVAVSDLDPLRDEGLDYAQRLVQAGVPTELHLFPGTFHGAAGFVPDTAVTRRMTEGALDALRRGLAV